MTVAGHGPRLTPRDLDEAAAELRARGLRLSAARRALLGALFAASAPASAERLAAEVAPDADLASVYRNLELFERVGLVRHMHLGHGPGLYATGEQADREFLVCERCGRLRSVAPGELDPLRDQIEDRYGFRVAFTHFPLAGLCADCAAEAR